MTSEFLESLIPETVENRAEIVKRIAAEAGKDITREQKKFADYDTIKTDLTAAQATIADLKKSTGDVATLEQKIRDYETKEAERAETEKKTAKQREVAQRFAAVKGDVEFLDPAIEEAVIAKFSATIDDPANKGKGDSELYASLTKDKPFFKSQNPPANMGGVGGATNPNAGQLLQQQYDDAVKNGRTAEAVSLKNKLFALPK